MLLGAAGEKLECCRFIICLKGIELVYVCVSFFKNEINEYNIECVFYLLMDGIMTFWWGLAVILGLP